MRKSINGYGNSGDSLLDANGRGCRQETAALIGCVNCRLALGESEAGADADREWRRIVWDKEMPHASKSPRR